MANKWGSRSKVYFNVAPRYTPGSPAMVDEKTARTVAFDELQAWQRLIEGGLGAEEQARAKREGVLGIAEQRTERPGCWIVNDLITGQEFVRPFEVYAEKEDAKRRRLTRLRVAYGLKLEEDLNKGGA